jgi:hypothetical protein
LQCGFEEMIIGYGEPVEGVSCGNQGAVFEGSLFVVVLPSAT